MTEPRIPTAVDAVADGYLYPAAVHDPIFATYIGLAGYNSQMPSLDPEWLAERSDHRRQALQALAGAESVDANDRVTAAALRQQLEIEEELRAMGVEEAVINNVAAPVQEVRDIFDLNPTASADDWSD